MRPSRVNRWGLSGSQCAAMDALVKHGSAKGVAAALDIKHQSACNALRSCFVAMKARSDVEAVLLWERERAAQERLAREVARTESLRVGYCPCSSCNGFGFVPKVAAA